MPLLLSKKIDEYSAYAIWNIQETFLELPYLSPEPFPAALNPIRQAEWIIGRILIKRLCEAIGSHYRGVGKYENGKPFLKESDVHISISHSFPIAAAMVHLNRPCGIDMERPRTKHRLVQHKFLHASELQYRGDLEKLCTIWCAKEVIYKIFGRKFLSLKDEIETKFETENTMIGKIIKPDFESVHRIFYETVKGYILAYGI